MSRDSSVSIATRYGLESLGIESRWGEIFRTYPDRFRGPPSLLSNGYRVFPGGKGGRDVMLTTHPFLVPRLRKSWAIPPLTLWVLLGLLQGSLYLYFTSNINSFCKQWMRNSMPLNDLFCTLFTNDEKVGQITRACLCVPHTPKKHCHGSQMTYCCCCYTSGHL
jgi:hypothetical protein